MPPPVGQVSVTSKAGSVTGWLTAPFVSLGQEVGGWTVADRDGDVGVPEFTGVPPEAWEFTLRFEGWAARASQRTQVEALLAMGTRGDAVRPGTVSLAGSVPPSVAGRPWILTQATPVREGVIDDDAGRLYRLDVACQILQPVTAKPISAPMKAKAGRTKTARTVAAKKSKPGESLLQLLVRVRGTSANWRPIADLNSIRDPGAKLKPGQKIRLP